MEPKIVVIRAKREYRIDAEWLGWYQRVQRNFILKNEELLKALQEDEVDPCAVNPYAVDTLCDVSHSALEAYSLLRQLHRSRQLAK